MCHARLPEAHVRTCGDQEEWSELSRVLQRLAHLVDVNPEVYDVVDAYRVAVAYAIDAQGRVKQWNPLQMIIESVSELTARHPRRPSIQRVLGTALERSTDHLGDDGRLDEVAVAWKHLQELADRWPNDLDLQRLLARVGVNVMSAYAKPLHGNPDAQDWKNFAQVWSIIESLADTLANDREVQRMAARAAVGALQEWPPAGRSAKIQRASEQLRQAAQRFPADRDIEKVLQAARDRLGFSQQ